MVDHLLKNSQNKSEDYINQLHELNTDFNNVQERYFNECFELQKAVDLQDKAKYEMSCKAFEEIPERYRARRCSPKLAWATLGRIFIYP